MNPVRTVEVSVEQLNPDGSPSGTPVPQEHFLYDYAPIQFTRRGRNISNVYRWVVCIKGVTVGRKYRLTVSVPDSDASDHVEVDVQTTFTTVPVLAYPDMDNYRIEAEELNYFLTYGTVPPNKPVTAASIGGKAADCYNTILPGDDTSSTMAVWWAEFLDLDENPGGGSHGLVITNIDGPTIRTVNIDEVDVGDTSVIEFG
ncbi:MAG: hypothetical protein ACFCD0_23095 [Gemmataceae bacterium]